MIPKWAPVFGKDHAQGKCNAFAGRRVQGSASLPRKRARTRRSAFPRADARSRLAALPLAIRRRFSKRLSGGNTAVYVGEVIETQMSRAGWRLAQAARLIGGPLPVSRDAHVPSVVTVTEDVATSGQHWTRLYARRRGFPQVVHSSKRFAGPTGLEEYVGCGVGMALTIHVRRMSRKSGTVSEGHALSSVFRAAHYFLQLGRFRLRLPAWATPGALERHPRRARRRRASCSSSTSHTRGSAG